MLLSEGFEADLAATGVAFGAFDDLAPLLLAIRIGGLVVPSPLARKPFPAMLLLSPLFEALALAPPGPFPVVFRLFLGAASRMALLNRLLPLLCLDSLLLPRSLLQLLLLLLLRLLGDGLHLPWPRDPPAS